MSRITTGEALRVWDRMLNKTAFSGYIHFEDLQHVFMLNTMRTVEKAAWQIPLLPMELRKTKEHFFQERIQFNGCIIDIVIRNGIIRKVERQVVSERKATVRYYLTIYNDQTTVKWTTSKNKDTVEMYAVWKKASNEKPASPNESLPEGVYKLKHVGTGKMMNYHGVKEFAYKPFSLIKRWLVEQTFIRPVSNGKYESDIMHKKVVS